MRARARGLCAVRRGPPRGWRARPRSALAGVSVARGARGRRWRRTGAAPGRSPRAVCRTRPAISHPRPSDSSDIPASAIPDWISSCCRTCVRWVLSWRELARCGRRDEPAGAGRLRECRRLHVDRGRDHEDRSVAIARSRGYRGRWGGTEVVGFGEPGTPCRRMHCATAASAPSSGRKDGSSSRGPGGRRGLYGPRWSVPSVARSSGRSGG